MKLCMCLNLLCGLKNFEACQTSNFLCLLQSSISVINKIVYQHLWIVLSSLKTQHRENTTRMPERLLKERLYSGQTLYFQSNNRKQSLKTDSQISIPIAIFLSRDLY